MFTAFRLILRKTKSYLFMKRLLLLFICTFALCAWSVNPVYFKIKIHKPGSVGSGIKRQPPQMPKVDIDDHILFFGEHNSEYVLQLQDGTSVIYETTVPQETGEILLPESFTGDYELILMVGDYVFVGNITL